MIRTLAAAAVLVALAAASALPAAAATFEVTSAQDDGAGSLRDAIEQANDAPGSTIHIQPGLEIHLAAELPPIRADGTTLAGGGATLREGEGCERPGHKKGCDGIVVTGAGVTVRALRVAGFLFDGISVRGRGARDVHVEHVEAVDNLDDGIGISQDAGPVFVDHCLSMGNGFRTKGKGVLVFSDANATIRNSVMVGNRDGVTVTRGSHARLEHVIVVANYDKGVGASAGEIDGADVAVLANGRIAGAPNADGVRAGLGASIRLRSSRIAGNGDTGVVVLDTSTASLEDCTIEGNRVATSVAPTARLRSR